MDSKGCELKYNFLITEENDSEDDSSEKAVNTLIALGELELFESVIFIGAQKYAGAVKKKQKFSQMYERSLK